MLNDRVPPYPQLDSAEQRLVAILATGPKPDGSAPVATAASPVPTTQPAVAGASEEASLLRAELASVQEQLEAVRANAAQYSAISRAAEERLRDLNRNNDVYRTHAEGRMAALVNDASNLREQLTAAESSRSDLCSFPCPVQPVSCPASRPLSGASRACQLDDTGASWSSAGLTLEMDSGCLACYVPTKSSTVGSV